MGSMNMNGKLTIRLFNINSFSGFVDHVIVVILFYIWNASYK